MWLVGRLASSYYEKVILLCDNFRGHMIGQHAEDFFPTESGIKDTNLISEDHLIFLLYSFKKYSLKCFSGKFMSKGF